LREAKNYLNVHEVNISLLLVYKQKFHTGEAGISRFAEAYHFSCEARKKALAKSKDDRRCAPRVVPPKFTRRSPNEP
jgi:hypothetical protein